MRSTEGRRAQSTLSKFRRLDARPAGSPRRKEWRLRGGHWIVMFGLLVVFVFYLITLSALEVVWMPLLVPDGNIGALDWLEASMAQELLDVEEIALAKRLPVNREKLGRHNLLTDLGNKQTNNSNSNNSNQKSNSNPRHIEVVKKN